MVGVVNATELVGVAGNVSDIVSNSIYQTVQPFIGIIKAIGIVVLIYVIVLIIKGITSIKSSLRLKSIAKNVEQINEKLDVLVGKKKK